MKQYITYTRVKANDSLYLDPNTNNSFENATKDSRFNETPYEVDWTYLAFVEYPDLTSPEVLLWLIKSYSEFNFKFISEEEANEFLAKIWGEDNWEQLITVKDYEFTNNRPLDIY